MNHSSWQWVDGSGAFYSYWSSREPNNYGGNEDCVVMNPYIGTWNDQGCWKSHYYVCEINGNTTFYNNKYNQKVKKIVNCLFKFAINLDISHKGNKGRLLVL